MLPSFFIRKFMLQNCYWKTEKEGVLRMGSKRLRANGVLVRLSDDEKQKI